MTISLQAIINQLNLGNYGILNLVPLPQQIKTEDGWVFYLQSDGEKYISADGLAYQISEILELISMQPTERVRNMTPAFSLDWEGTIADIVPG